ncbi:MAG TPA: ABC transporter ATP-binding protein [Vicinamibacteria bacterium]
MLTLRGLRKRYSGAAAPAVDGLSLEVRPGEVFGLLGPNGAGKTTTVALATGLLSPDEGQVELVGLGSPRDPRVRARLGVAPQALSLYDGLSGEENAALFGRLYGLKAPKLAARVAAALDFVGLRDRGRDLVSSYSGGMKRRLNLAVAIVHEPDLVVLDEPTVGVDPQSRNLIFENIRALQAAGTTVIYTTHYMEEAERLCDRVGILDHGRLLALDSVPGLLRTHAGRPVLAAEVERPGGQGTEERLIATDDPLAELNALAARERVRAFRVERADLEQVFLRLTGRHMRD